MRFFIFNSLLGVFNYFSWKVLETKFCFHVTQFAGDFYANCSEEPQIGLILAVEDKQLDSFAYNITKNEGIFENLPWFASYFHLRKNRPMVQLLSSFFHKFFTKLYSRNFNSFQNQKKNCSE